MKAIICDDMNTSHLLEGSGIYYIYNEVSGTLWQIDRPTALSDWKEITLL